MPSSRLLPALLVAAGLAVGGAVALDRSGADVGDVAPVPVPVVDPAGSGAPAPPSDPAASPAPVGTASTASTASAPPAVGRRSGRLADREPSAPAPAPARLALPAVGIDADVVPVGVDDLGRMGVPIDVATVGWYRFGPAPADDGGTVVLAGHVDDRTQGAGAFLALRDVRVGDPVSVHDEAGATTTWRVVGRRTYEKATLPVASLYQRTGGRRLVMITCGGDFDAAARSYRANVVVVAEPVG